MISDKGSAMGLDAEYYGVEPCHYVTFVITTHYVPVGANNNILCSMPVSFYSSFGFFSNFANVSE